MLTTNVETFIKAVSLLQKQPLLPTPDLLQLWSLTLTTMANEAYANLKVQSEGLKCECFMVKISHLP